MSIEEARRTLGTAWRLGGHDTVVPEGIVTFDDAPFPARIIECRGGLVMALAAGDFVWRPGADEVEFSAARNADTLPWVLPREVPAEWRETLAAVSEGAHADCPCYLAGGALRDLVLRREPKDIDIFVGPSWNVENASALGTVEIVKEGAPIDRDPKSWSEGDKTNIERIYEITRPSGALYQVIERAPNPIAENMLEQFDFGICRIAWHAVEGWTVHDDFLADLGTRIFRARAVPYAPATLRRAESFALRFPGWRFDLTAAGGKSGLWLPAGDTLLDSEPMPF